MKHTSIYRILKIFFLSISFLGIYSCSKDADNDLMAANTELSQTELTTILEADQWTGAMDEVILDLFEKNTAVAAKFADESCYEISYTETGFRAVFGNCVLNTTDQVNGILEVTFTSSTDVTSFTATYTDFFVGMIQLNGSRSFTIGQSGDTNLVLAVESDMSVLLEDGTTLSESGIKYLEFQFGASLGETSYTLGGEWTVTRGDTVYIVSASQPLAGNLQCEFLVSGLMDVSKNGLEIGVDFGDGNCDNLVTLTYPNGATEEVAL